MSPRALIADYPGTRPANTFAQLITRDLRVRLGGELEQREPAARLIFHLVVANEARRAAREIAGRGSIYDTGHCFVSLGRDPRLAGEGKGVYGTAMEVW